MTPQQMVDNAFDNKASIKSSLAELEKMGAEADPQSQEFRDIVDATRTLQLMDV